MENKWESLATAFVIIGLIISIASCETITTVSDNNKEIEIQKLKYEYEQNKSSLK